MKEKINEAKIRSAIRKIVQEEYEKAIEEATPGQPAQPAASQTPAPNDGDVVNKLLSKIPNLPAVQQLIRRIPQRSPQAAAEIIMSLIEAMEQKTSEPKARLISRELIFMLRDKIQSNK